MKGRTKCPKCNHDFILDIPNDKEKYSTTCPSCNYKFNIKKTIECEDAEEECIWEEHGEPRKTILSSMKPRTDKPMITSFILIIVFIINLISAISIQLYTKIFINSTFGFLINYNLNTSEFLFYLSIILLIFSFIALLGSIFSYKRSRFNIVIICSFINIFSIGFYFFGSILSIIAIIIIFYSKEEFLDEKKEKIF